MNITLSASKQWKLRCCGSRQHLIPFTHSSLYRNNSTECDPPSHDGESIVAQVVELLQAPENDWKTDQLHQLLFTGSTPVPRDFLRITLQLGSSSRALNFLEYIRANTPSEQYPSLSSVFQGVLELANREPNSGTKLLEFYRKSKEHQVPLSAKSATLLVESLGKARMVDELLLLFNELDPSSKNTRVCNTVVGTLLRLGRTDDALQVLEEMLKPNSEFHPNVVTGDVVFAELVKRQRSGRSFTEEEIVSLVVKLGEHSVFPDTFKLTQLITKLCGNRKNGLAWDLLHVIMKLGRVVEAASCNALLTGLGRDRDFPKMNELLAKMKEMEIQPNVVTFGILINHLCKSRRIDEALDVFVKMRGKGESNLVCIEPDVIIFNTLIDGLCKVGRQDDGLSLLEEMKKKNEHKANTVSYNCLIDGFCKVGDIDKALELFNQMNEEEVQQNVVTFNTLIDGMCKHGRVHSAVHFFNEMQSKGLKGNAITYTMLISAFCNVNNIDKAMQYFDEMLNSGCFLDAIAYYSLICGLSLAGRMDDASFVVSKMKEAGFCLDLASYNVLISGFCKKKKLEKVQEMLEEMEQNGVKPDTVTYNTLVSYLGKARNFALAVKVMRKMTKEGHAPSVVTYGSLINAYCLNGNVDEAMKIFRDMSSTSKVPPNTVIYNILIDSLCKNEDVERAVSLMDDMRAKGVKPNTTTYNAIFKGIRDKNMLQKAFQLMNRMVEDACNPDYITMEILTEWLSAVGEVGKLKQFVRGHEVPSLAGVDGLKRRGKDQARP
ncbi:hypothetical protein L6164_003940 [Bauhinia variegata]|uniref:Uncharacterized protein n=1 Tax=Bauhinia variegata TaxID=167791 RepID=A0ACB9Q3G4_BAUVA|nr:hypothetical protein L6164_003940 [Bauhinia variegata]